MSATDMHELTGVYALDAMDPDEAEAFEAHLAWCAPCRREVQELQAVAGALALVEVTVPPPALRERIFGAITQPDAPDAAPHPARAPLTRPDVRWRVAAAAAAAVAIIVGLALGADRLGSPATQDAGVAVSRAAATASAVVRDPEVETILLQGPAGATGQVRWSERAARGVLTVRGLPPPGAGRVYELWYIDGATRPGPVFDADTTTVVIDGRGTRPPKSFAVTIEPAGGVATSTGPVVLAGGSH
jgi:anti-sigma-K factor RskA